MMSKKYEVIKRLVDENGNKDRAALTLGITKRQVYRLIKVYREKARRLCSWQQGRKPVSTIPDSTRDLVLDLYKTKYYEANFTHFTELLERIEGIKLSVSTVTSILEADYILSPRVTKAKRKRIKKELKARHNTAKSKKEATQIQANLVAVEDAHSRRPRCAYFGELEQMDASAYKWFGTGAYFDRQETLSGYYHVFHQILTPLRHSL